MKTAVKTSKKELLQLEEKANKAKQVLADYRAYLKQYRTEHKLPFEKGTLIKEIITLHKKGYKNAEIVAEGYNKNTVSKFVAQFKKGQKIEKTVVKKYLVEEDEGDEE